MYVAVTRLPVITSSGVQVKSADLKYSRSKHASKQANIHTQCVMKSH